jgi:hypothetical protein
MGKALAEAFPAARDVFDEVYAALGQKLTNIIWNGPGCVKSASDRGRMPAGPRVGRDGLDVTFGTPHRNISWSVPTSQTLD